MTLTPLLSISSDANRMARSLLDAAVVKHRTGDLDGAAEDYRQVLVIAPNNADAFHLLGLVLYQRGVYDGAADLIERAMSLNPRPAEYAYNLGKVRAAQEHWVASAAANRTALALKPDYADAHCNLGVALIWMGRASAAENSLRAALARDVNHAAAWSALGLALRHQCRDAEAEAAWEKAIALQPDLAEAQFNLATSRLAAKDFARGWPAFASRALADPASYNAPSLHQPPWRGEALGGKSILVWGEQGLGDQILFAGLIPDLLAQEAKVTLACEPRLVSMFTRSFPTIAVRSRALPIDDIMTDFHAPLGSLGEFLRRDAASFPAHTGYLRADPARVDELRQRYRAHAHGNPIVGISWRSARRRSGVFKSTDLSQEWAPVLRTPGVTFVNLQYGAVESALAQASVTHGATIESDPALDAMTDVDGWAAHVSAVDLVISVSNTAVHVAGATNTPVWTLSPAGAGRLWYWFDGQDHSLWYPSMRLYHQSSPGDWSGVMSRVAQDLAARRTA